MNVSMYNTLTEFIQSVLAANAFKRFPVYTKSYHPNENIEHCRRTSKIQNKWKIPLNFIHERLFATMTKQIGKGIIHLVRLQNFPKNEDFLPPDTHKYVYVSRGKKCCFSENFANVLNQWSEIEVFEDFKQYGAAHL